MTMTQLIKLVLMLSVPAVEWDIKMPEVVTAGDIAGTQLEPTQHTGSSGTEAVSNAIHTNRAAQKRARAIVGGRNDRKITMEYKVGRKLGSLSCRSPRSLAQQWRPHTPLVKLRCAVLNPTTLSTPAS